MEKVLRGNEVFGESCNWFKSVVALTLCFGAIHFNLALILFAIFFLSLSKALLYVFFLLHLFLFIFLLLAKTLFLLVFQFACQAFWFPHAVYDSSC